MNSLKGVASLNIASAKEQKDTKQAAKVSSTGMNTLMNVVKHFQPKQKIGPSRQVKSSASSSSTPSQIQRMIGTASAARRTEVKRHVNPCTYSSIGAAVPKKGMSRSLEAVKNRLGQSNNSTAHTPSSSTEISKKSVMTDDFKVSAKAADLVKRRV